MPCSSAQARISALFHQMDLSIFLQLQPTEGIHLSKCPALSQMPLFPRVSGQSALGYSCECSPCRSPDHIYSRFLNPRQNSIVGVQQGTVQIPNKRFCHVISLIFLSKLFKTVSGSYCPRRATQSRLPADPSHRSPQQVTYNDESATCQQSCIKRAVSALPSPCQMAGVNHGSDCHGVLKARRKA